jgi:hypothetical protein
MRPLGGTAPFRPKAEAGTMQGAATALAAKAARLRNCRRVTGNNSRAGAESGVLSRCSEAVFGFDMGAG